MNDPFSTNRQVVALDSIAPGGGQPLMGRPDSLVPPVIDPSTANQESLEEIRRRIGAFSLAAPTVSVPAFDDTHGLHPETGSR